MRNTLLKNPESIISAASVATDAEDAEDAVDPADGGMDVEWREILVRPEQHHQRLDKTLADAMLKFSRSYLQQLILEGAVAVNGAIQVKPSTRVKAGDLCQVGLRPTPQSHAFEPEHLNLNIVFEDRDLLVLHKPAGLVVHPAPGNWSGTLLNGLLAHAAAFTDLPRAGIVHRLDKDTSGLMLVAKTRQSMDALVTMIAERRVQRQYLALAHKPWTGAATRDVQSVIGRDPANRLRMAVVDPSRHAGKPARTTVDLVTGNEASCLVRCTLHTGRTHQIRVHMASIGHPLVADQTYGGRVTQAIQRQALHAYHLALPHPVTGAALDFVAPLPGDFSAELRVQALSYNLR